LSLLEEAARLAEEGVPPSLLADAGSDHAGSELSST